MLSGSHAASSLQCNLQISAKQHWKRQSAHHDASQSIGDTVNASGMLCSTTQVSQQTMQEETTSEFWTSQGQCSLSMSQSVTACLISRLCSMRSMTIDGCCCAAFHLAIALHAGCKMSCMGSLYTSKSATAILRLAAAVPCSRDIMSETYHSPLGFSYHVRDIMSETYRSPLDFLDRSSL